MRIDCPHCGPRSIEEFTIKSEVKPERPGEDASDQAYVDYTYIANNPRGRNQEHWHHSGGCRAWLVVDRDTVTHEIFSIADVREGR